MAVKEFGWTYDTTFSLRFAGMVNVHKAWLAAPAPLACTGGTCLAPLPQEMSSGLAQDVFKKLLTWPSGFQAGGAFHLTPAILPSLGLLLRGPGLVPWPLYLRRYSVAVDWSLWSQIIISVRLHTLQPSPFNLSAPAETPVLAMQRNLLFPVW